MSPRLLTKCSVILPFGIKRRWHPNSKRSPIQSTVRPFHIRENDFLGAPPLLYVFNKTVALTPLLPSKITHLDINYESFMKGVIDSNPVVN